MIATPHDEASGSGVDRNLAAASERRQSPRHRLRDAPGTLGWVHRDERITCGMTVLDLSGGGAAVRADRAPPVDQPAWIRLNSGAAGPDRVDARVVSTSAEPSGMHVVRLQFTSWIPLGNVLDQHEEHRLWERYPARETRAVLAWFEHNGELTHPGELLNISGGGAAVVTDAALPESQPVWLSLSAASAGLAPVECRLVALSIDASGLRIARLRFVEPCPMELFELAVHGAPDQP